MSLLGTTETALVGNLGLHCRLLAHVLRRNDLEFNGGVNLVRSNLP
jgi:hypothetical protein